MSEATWIWCPKCRAMRRPHGNVMPKLETVGEWGDVFCSSCRELITTLSCGTQFGSGLSDGPLHKLQNRSLKPLGPQEFPKCKYHASEPSRLVHNPDEDAALGEDWVNSPALFNARCIDCAGKLMTSRAYAFTAADETKHGPLCLPCMDRRSAAEDAAKAAAKKAELDAIKAQPKGKPAKAA
jgi:hypothetical protein